MWQWVKNIFSRDRMWRQFRYPALAEANKALFAVEEEIVDFNQVAAQMELYKKAQELPEKDRDTACIPVYLQLEHFVATHQPPVVKQVLDKQQIRDKIKAVLALDQMNEGFRLIFLPDNQQFDHLLKQGAHALLQFLLTSLGRSQLETLIKESVGSTALGAISISDDGISFAIVHQQLQLLPADQVLATYRQMYQALFSEIKNLFGTPVALEQFGASGDEILTTYGQEFYSIYLTVIPGEAKAKA